MSTLEQHLAALKQGDHVCLLYDDMAEALATAAPYIASGLARGERCLFIAGDLSLDHVARALAVQEVNVRMEQERGALLLWPSFDACFLSGTFDPAELIAFLRTLAHEAVAAGFAGLRLVGDMSWTRGMAIAHDKLVIYEALWNELVSTAPLLGMCLYARSAFAPEMLRDALRTHPLALLEGHLCQNLYYEPPRLVVDPAALAARVDWMVTQLVQSHLAQERLQEAEAQYRRIFETTSDGLLLFDQEDRIVEANPALCRMYGYTCAELLGRPLTMLFPADQRDAVAAFRHTLAVENDASTSLPARRKDDTTFYVGIHAVNFPDRERLHCLWVVRDVTVQVQARQLLEQRVEERTHELTTLLGVARSLSSILELEPLVQTILTQLRRVVDFTAASIRVVQGEGFVVLAYQGPDLPEQGIGRPSAWPGAVAVFNEVIRSRTPQIIDDVWDDAPLACTAREGLSESLATAYRDLPSWLGVPLLLKDRVLGVLSLAHTEAGYYTQQRAELVMAIASHIALAIENARLYQQVQETTITEERTRLAHEMHDSLSQILFYVNLQAEAVRTLLHTGQTDRAAEQSEQLAQAAREAYTDVREDILALRTAGTTGGLLESLRTYLPLWQEQSGVHAELVVSPAEVTLPALSSATEIHLVRIVQEALTNVRKHARARQVQICISAGAGHVTVEIEDDGVGFDPAVPEQSALPHFGLTTMRERAAAAGGHLEIDARSGHGTRVRVRVPVEAVPREAVRRDRCV